MVQHNHHNSPMKTKASHEHFYLYFAIFLSIDRTPSSRLGNRGICFSLKCRPRTKVFGVLSSRLNLLLPSATSMPSIRPTDEKERETWTRRDDNRVFGVRRGRRVGTDGLLNAVVCDLVFFPLTPGVERFELGLESKVGGDWRARLLRRFFDSFFLGVGVCGLVLSACFGKEELSVIVVGWKSWPTPSSCSGSGASE